MREEGRITGLRRGVACSEVAARNEGAAGTNPSRLEEQGSQKVSKNFLGRGSTTKQNLRRCLHRCMTSAVCADEGQNGAFISIRFFMCKALFKVSFSSGDERAYFVV